MNPALIVVLAVLAIGAAASGAGSSKRQRSSGRRGHVDEGCPPGWIEDPGFGCLSMDECDPLDESTWMPGYICVRSAEGYNELVRAADPMAIGDLNYRTLGDEDGVRMALRLLGHTSTDLRTALADFQNHLTEIYHFGPEDVRLDGRLDQNTIDWLLVALTDLQSGYWKSPQELVAARQEQFEEELAATPEEWVDVVSVNERPNAEVVVGAWGPDVYGKWPMHRNELTAFSFYDSDSDDWDAEAEDGQLFSTWLTNLVYWGTYANHPEAVGPRSFYPVPYTERWEQERPFREAWQRINRHVLELMTQVGAVDAPFNFGE